MLTYDTWFSHFFCWESMSWQSRSKAMNLSWSQTCNDDRICPGWSELQRHLMLVFVYSQVVLIGKPLQHVNDNNRGKVHVLYERGLRIIIYLSCWPKCLNLDILLQWIQTDYLFETQPHTYSQYFTHCMWRNQYQWCTISSLKRSEWTYWSQSAGAQISQAKLELCKTDIIYRKLFLIAVETWLKMSTKWGNTKTSSTNEYQKQISWHTKTVAVWSERRFFDNWKKCESSTFSL